MMKYSLLALLCWTLVGYANPAPEILSFYSGTYAELQAYAKAENRPYFVNFYTSWCSPCTRMNETTYSDGDLIDYVRRNYLAYTTDAESFAEGGLELADEYKVLFYPTILIFSPEGELLHKSTGFKSAEALTALLKEYRFYGEQPDRPILTGTPKPTPSKPKPVPPLVQSATSGKGLYSVSVSRQASAGHGVQIGVFSDFANVLSTVQLLESQGYRDVLVHVDELKGKTVFRIIMGPFATKTQADSRKKKLKQQGKDGLVVPLSRFK